MCILFISLNQVPEFPCIILANRDEFRARPTSPLQFWNDYPDILAGRDEKEGGTWLGLSKQGKISALTNVRDLKAHKEGRKSRGYLVRDYLTTNQSNESFIQNLTESTESYNPYNLLFSDLRDYYIYSNLEKKVHKLETGLYGLSNAFLDTNWPKIQRGKEKIRKAIAEKPISGENFLDLMNDTQRAPDSELPDTGVGIERERILSSICIDDSFYGTRSSAVILINAEKQASFWERTFDSNQKIVSELHFQVKLDS